MLYFVEDDKTQETWLIDTMVPPYQQIFITHLHSEATVITGFLLEALMTEKGISPAKIKDLQISDLDVDVEKAKLAQDLRELAHLRGGEQLLRKYFDDVEADVKSYRERITNNETHRAMLATATATQARLQVVDQRIRAVGWLLWRYQQMTHTVGTLYKKVGDFLSVRTNKRVIYDADAARVWALTNAPDLLQLNKKSFETYVTSIKVPEGVAAVVNEDQILIKADLSSILDPEKE